MKLKGIDILNIVVIIFVIILAGWGLSYIITKTAVVFGWILFAAAMVTMLIAAMANSALEA